MKRKPKGAKFRNLTARGGVIYYERILDGRRIRFSCQTDDWDQAVAVRDYYEERRAQPRAGVASGALPSFGDFARRYLEESVAGAA